MRTRRRDQERRGPDAFGWTPEDLRSAYAADGSGPYRYAPDGAGPFSYDPDGSGPWLVGPSGTSAAGGSASGWAPRVRGSGNARRRLGTAVVTGTLTLAVTIGSVGLVVHGHGVHRDAETVIHMSEQLTRG
ncbi:hypothetical protein [Curtobacterium sp. RRHDQ10]|uniref:hypothetical protein n=1 Tax=Curtobacterium phyllosphaerae TaxID=3413379 RepID=UPI003BF282A0